MNEKFISRLVERVFLNKGHVVVPELRIDESVVDGTLSLGMTPLRIDLATLDPTTGILTFIEVENGFWMNHPVKFKKLANHVYIAAPGNEGIPIEIACQQWDWAQEEGIGVFLITRELEVIEVLKPKYFPVPRFLKKKLIERMLKRLKQP